MGIILAIVFGLYFAIGLLLAGMHTVLCVFDVSITRDLDIIYTTKHALGLFFAWPFYLK